MSITTTEPLNTPEAARVVGLSPRTLEKYRTAGRGPAYLKLGRIVRYERRELEAWKTAHRVSSTSEEVRA